MDFFSFVYFFSFIVYIYFGIYSLFLNRRSLLNILFFTYCIFLSIWSLGNTFLYSAIDIKSAWFWYKIGGLGWCFIQPWGILFALVLSKKDKLYKNPFFVISIFIPGILFYYKVLFDTLFVANFDIESKIIIGYFSNFTLI
ncbi:MAG TPA: histidine kinase N-terminal 7TM domain-containing protein, partial [Spirochaetota bacterium]|nr:histidine kinase N-terminal 7TM domain-containing protein [Spirochaetota bacterium]